MFKAIIISVISLVLFQLSDLVAFTLLRSANINGYGPYSTALPSAVLVVATIICVVLLFFIMARVKHRWPIAIIIGAGFSNLLDRLIYGGVVDYINLFNISIINVADIAITVSLIILICLLARDHTDTISAKPGV